MNLKTLHIYPLRVVKLLAVFGQLEKKNGGKPMAVTYKGLLSVMPGTKYEALRLQVMETRKNGLIEVAKAGRGRGDKSAFALTEKGREALKE